MLSSLNAVTKESAIVARILGSAAPDPRIGSEIELSGRHPGRLLDLLGVGKALASQGIAAEEPPPALLQIEPACPGRDEDVMDARMLFEPGACLKAVVTTESIGDDEDLAGRIVGFNVGKPRNVALGIARGRTAGQHPPIADPQRSIDPGFLGPPLIIQGCFDAVPIRRPAGGWRKGSGNYWPEFVGADGRRARRWRGVVADDRRPFGTKSLSRGVPQLCVCRQRTLSFSRMRRIWLRFTRMPASLAACASASKLH